MKRILGTSDEVTTCECCGRTGLKTTIIIGTEEGEAYYGTTCASKFLGGSGTRRAGEKLLREAQIRGTEIGSLRAFITRLWEVQVGPREDWLEWCQRNTKRASFRPGDTPLDHWVKAIRDAHNDLQKLLGE
jgi:hypothetical protein